MKHLVLTEYGRIQRTDSNHRLLSQLQSFDEKWSRKSGQSIFDWNDRRFVRAKNYVGVIAVPAGTVEILPKTDTNDASKVKAQHNLLYMLSITQKIVGHERDIAAIGKKRVPLLEQLITLFAVRTLSELKKGVAHAYVAREENLTFLKGKLMVGRQAVCNAAHREKMYCQYDDFLSDTPINFVIKAASKKILLISRSNNTQKILREIIFLLDGVSDFEPIDHDFKNIYFNRNTERFKTLVDFSQLVIQGMSPSWSSGREISFSLLFSMHELFEEFIARYIIKNADYFKVPHRRIHPQAAGKRKWLLWYEHGKVGKFRLKPDLVIDQADGETMLVLDTKWKHLLSDEDDPKNGVSQADIYQLYAYAHRYESPDNILLFPYVYGVSPKVYRVEGHKSDYKIRIEFIDLNRDLLREGAAFKSDLFKVLFAADNGDSYCTVP